MTAALLLASAYLVGSVPFSYLVARLFGVADVRKVGSGNVGAANVMRSAGKAAGVLAFLLDAGMGAAAAVLARERAPGSALLPPLAAATAVIGHMYPVWLRFQGGKGVATGAGAFLPLVPAATISSFLVFLVVTAATRYVSLGSVAGALSLAVAVFVAESPAPVRVTAVLVAALVVWKHRGNLERILRGTERRLGDRGQRAARSAPE
jgi:glycerol-3-phosphate acyltransferase PlsY